MKKLLAILILSIVAINCQAQRRLKYGDIFAKLGTEPVEKTFIRFFEYQKQDPEFPNTYFQMGLISWNWLKDEDPFIHYKECCDLLYNSRLYLGLALSKINADDKEVKRNKAYYKNVQMIPDMSVLEQADVVAYIQKVRKDIDEYEKNINLIIGNFNKTVDKYNHCVNTFKDIVGEQNNYKNLLMTSSKPLRAKMTDLQQSFDSVSYFFNEYKASLGNYPIKDYNQKIKLVPIVTYRLEGLTGSDFLQPEIPIWDYGTWISQAFGISDGNIGKLRQDAIAYIKKLRSEVDNYKKNNTITDNVSEYYVKDRLLNEIEKYDYKSLMTALLEYEKDKANLNLKTMMRSNHLEDSISINESLTRKIAHVYNLEQNVKTMQTSLSTVENRSSVNNCNKLQDFIETLYGSASDFQSKYKNNQEAEINSLQSSYLENLKSFTVAALNPTGSINYKGATIPTTLSLQKVGDGEKGYNTVCSVRDVFGNTYIGGYMKQSATSSQAFVLKVNRSKTILWMRTFNLDAMAHDCVMNVLPSSNGYVLVVSSVKAASCKNYVLQFDANGKQVAKVDLSSTLAPQAAFYDEINETVFVGLKGAQANFFGTNIEDVVFEKASLLAKSSQVLTAYSLQGNIVGLAKLENSVVAICNYNQISDKGSVNLSSNKGGIVNVTFGIDGEKGELTPFDTKESVYAAAVEKINGQTIGVVGFTTQVERPVVGNGKVVYYTADKTGKVILCSYQK